MKGKELDKMNDKGLYLAVVMDKVEKLTKPQYKRFKEFVVNNNLYNQEARYWLEKLYPGNKNIPGSEY